MQHLGMVRGLLGPHGLLQLWLASANTMVSPLPPCIVHCVFLQPPCCISDCTDSGLAFQCIGSCVYVRRHSM